jgi:hypothetical protein
MRRRLQLCTLLFAWLLTTGSQWDAVQAFGWGRMIVTYAQSMPLAQAIELTFTADNLCGVCEAVSEAKQQEGGLTASKGKLSGKIVCAFPPATERMEPLAEVFTRRVTDEMTIYGEGRFPPSRCSKRCGLGWS